MLEYDIQSGEDISSLSSVTQSQLMQMVNQASPLSNKGGVLCFAGSSTGASGVGFPDVTSNPRYIRYVWIDVEDPALPVIKRYAGTYSGTAANPSAMSNLYSDWIAVSTGSASSVTTVMLGVADANHGIWLGQLKRAADGSADVTKANYIIRLDANGQYAEAVSLATLLSSFSAVTVDLIKGTPDGGTGKYIGFLSASASQWKYLDPAVDFSVAFNNRIPTTSILPGNNTYLLRTNGAGVVEWVDPNTLFSSFSSVPLSIIQQDGASDKDVMAWSSALGRWDNRTPDFTLFGNTGSTNDLLQWNAATGKVNITTPKLNPFTSGTTVNKFFRWNGTIFTPARMQYSVTAITYAASTAIDFSLDEWRTLAITGNVTFTTSNKLAGRFVSIKFTSNSSNNTFTFPVGWKWKTIKPTGLTFGVSAILYLKCYGILETDVEAHFYPIQVDGAATTFFPGGSYDVDFSGYDFIDMELAGSLTFSTINRAPGKTIRIRTNNTSGGSLVPTFPCSWRWTTAVPSSIADGEIGELVVTSYGTTNSKIVASYTIAGSYGACIITAADDSFITALNTTYNGTLVTSITNPCAVALTYAIDVAPLHGIVVLNTSNGLFSYTPAGGYSGPDSFGFYAIGGCVSDPATMTVTVTP